MSAPKLMPTPWSFDGCGVNSGDEYKSRIATLTRLNPDHDHRKAMAASGIMMACAPEAYELLRLCEVELMPDGENPGGRSELWVRIRELLAKMEGRAS